MNHPELEALYRDEYDSLVKLASRSVGRTRAEDVVQAAFIELMEGAAGDEDPLAYLVRRARNKSASERKLGRRQAAILLKEYGPAYLNEPTRGYDHAETQDSESRIPGITKSGKLLGYPKNSLGESTWT